MVTKKFPDLTGDGKVTQADILKGRGVDVIKKPGALRKQLGIKGKKPTPAKMLDRATKAPGKARPAKTLRGLG